MATFIDDELSVASNTAFNSYTGTGGETYDRCGTSGVSYGTVTELSPSEDELRGPMNSGMYCTNKTPAGANYSVVLDFRLRTLSNSADRCYALARFDSTSRVGYAAGWQCNSSNQMTWGIYKWSATAGTFTTVAGDDAGGTSTTPQLTIFDNYTLKFICTNSSKALYYKSRGADDSTYTLVCSDTSNNDYTDAGFAGLIIDGSSANNAIAYHFTAFDEAADSTIVALLLRNRLLD